MLLWLLTKLFGKPEEINGANRCPTYLYRWQMFSCPWFKLYLHRFVADDWSMDLHDHPKRFVSIGLYGGYTETTPAGDRKYRAPWARTFPGTHTHRVSLGKWSECWTLVAVLRGYRPWGFWHQGRWIHWKEYVSGKDSSIADQMKACGD